MRPQPRGRSRGRRLRLTYDDMSGLARRLSRGRPSRPLRTPATPPRFVHVLPRDPAIQSFALNKVAIIEAAFLKHAKSEFLANILRSIRLGSNLLRVVIAECAPSRALLNDAARWMIALILTAPRAPLAQFVGLRALDPFERRAAPRNA